MGKRFRFSALLVALALAATFSGLRSAEVPSPDAPVWKMGYTGETLVTVHMKDKLPEEVFSALAKQGGFRYDPDSNEVFSHLNTPLSLDCDKMPLWQALQQLCAPCKLNVGVGYNTRRIRLEMAQGLDSVSAGRTVIAGPFRLRLASARHTASVTYRQALAARDDFEIQIVGLRDPTTHFLSVAFASRVLEATDDHGNSLLPTGTATRGTGVITPLGNQLFFDTMVNLQYPPANAGTKITKLKGTLGAVLRPKTQAVSFDFAAGAALTKTVGDYELAVQKPDISARRTVIKIKITSTKAASNQRSDGFDSIVNSALLWDAAGHNLDAAQISSTGSTQSPTFSATFAPDHVRGGDEEPRAAPVKLTLDIPLEGRIIDVPFEFSNIQMP